ncbi:recombinase RecT [Nocardia sp. NPDC127526]|uniref:recombinase RecT n=1 Tax=Nocardia sp. NPDC127526 TaxID=3345393 RepID=UPI0036385DAE
MSSIAAAAESAEVTPASIITKYRDDIAAVLPPSMRARLDRWIRLAIGAVNSNPELISRVRADQGASMMQALMKCAALGHEPGQGLFHLVPKGQRIEGWEDYKGILQRIRRSGIYARTVVEAVYANDEFSYDVNHDERPNHKPAKGDRGEPVHAYAYAVYPDGSITEVALATAQMIAESKSKARGADNANSPWRNANAPMHKKVAIRALEKYVSTSAEDRRLPTFQTAVVTDIVDGTADYYQEP